MILKNKIYLLLLIVGVFISCEDDNATVNNENELFENEFIILIPKSRPIAITENNNNKIVLAYEDFDTVFEIEQRNKLCQINNDGEIEWIKDIPFEYFPDKSLMFVVDSSIFLHILLDRKLYLIQFDLDGNVINNDLVSNRSYNASSIETTTNGFVATNYESNSIIFDEYSKSGTLIDSREISFSDSEFLYSNLIWKNNKTYLFRIYNLDQPESPFYKDFDCYIFDSNNNLSNSILLTGLGNIGNVYSSYVFDNDNILMTTTKNETTGIKIILSLFDNLGNEISTIPFSGFDRSFNLSLLSNDKTCFLAQKNHLQEGKKLNFKVLDSDLNISFERNIGSLDNIGTFNFACYESTNSYYIYGLTDSQSGDFDLPNNSLTTDMFLYKLNK